MTIDNRTDAERKYDAERDGSAYTRQPDLDDPEVDQPLLPEEKLILAALADRIMAAPADQPFGQLVSGETIMGTFDGTTRQGWSRFGCVHVSTPLGDFTVDDAGTCSGGSADGERIVFDGATIAQLQELRAFLNSGAIEQLQATAVAWARGAAEPPHPAMARQSEYWIGREDGLRLVFEHARKRLEERGELPAA